MPEIYTSKVNEEMLVTRYLDDTNYLFLFSIEEV